MLAEIRRHFILAVVVVAIVMVVVSSIAHIEATTRMVPVPMSFADSDPNAADSDIGAFRDDHWFVADVQRTGKYRHRQKRNKKKGKHSGLHDVLLDKTLAVPTLGRMRAWRSCSLYRIDQCCSRDAAGRTWFCSAYQNSRFQPSCPS
jgi:hypothetical protein